MYSWSRQLPCDRRLAAWLGAPGSLTAHLRRAAQDFRLRRLGQHVGAALPDEARALGLARGALVREVLLMDGDVALVFAHSVAPVASLNGAWRALRGLGGRPLADMLYEDPTIARMPLEFRALAAADPLARRMAHALPDAQFPLWARRSVFLNKGEPLMVSEVFLPALMSRKAA